MSVSLPNFGEASLVKGRGTALAVVGFISMKFDLTSLLFESPSHPIRVTAPFNKGALRTCGG